MEDIFGTSLIVLGALGFLGLFQGALRPHERPLIWLAFVLRTLAAVATVELTRGVLGGGDMIIYHRVGLALSDRIAQDFESVVPTLFQIMMHEDVPLPVPFHGLGSATGAMNALSGLIVFVAGGSIYAACAIVGYGALFTGLGVYLALRDELSPTSARRLLVSVMLIPSVLFWSSALLKESVVLSGMFLMVMGGQWLARQHRFITGSIAMLLGAAIVAMLKAYILVPFGLAAGMWFYMAALRREGAPHLKAANILVGSLLAIALIVGTGKLFPEYALDTFAEEAARHQEIGARFTGEADYLLADEAGLDEEGAAIGDRGLQTQVQLAPIALFTALFRPLIFEAQNAQMLLNTLETTVVFGLALLAGYRGGLRGLLRRLSDTPVLMFCAVFTLGLGLGVGLASTNLGSLSRYRMPLMPFFAFLLLELALPREQPNTESSGGALPSGGREGAVNLGAPIKG